MPSVRGRGARLCSRRGPCCLARTGRRVASASGALRCTRRARVVASALAATRDVRPQRAAQRLLALVVGQLQVHVVDGQQPRAAEQRERHGQPQRLQPFQVAHGACAIPLGSASRSRPAAVSAASTRARACGPALLRGRSSARSEPPNRPLQQDLFAQLLADGQGRIELGDARHWASAVIGAPRPSLRAAAGRRPRRARGGFIRPVSASSRQVRPEPEGPVQRSASRARRVRPMSRNAQSAGALDPESARP